MTLRQGALRFIFALCIVAALGSCGSNAPELPALGADLTETSVSGLSSGGYMAGQFQVAHSDMVKGAAILAAGPYGCAQITGADAFPYYPAGAASNLAQARSSCTADWAGVPDSSRLLRQAAALADSGKIAALSSLKHQHIYLYWGADDRIVAKSVVEAARDFYLAAGVPADRIEFVRRNPGGHAFIASGKGAVCNASAPPFVDDCGYDQAGEILRFVYGPLEPKGVGRPENFLSFGQGHYAPAGATLADEGAAYIPSACREKPGCRVHIVFHGCGQSRADVGDAVTHTTSFADWAETNRIIVLFPQAAPSAFNPLTCWDWWGYTGTNFLTRDAPQIKGVAAMLARLAQPARR